MHIRITAGQGRSRTFLLVLLSVLMSGTVFFSIVHRNVFLYAFLGGVVLLSFWLGINSRRLVNGLIKISPFVLLILFNVILNFSQYTQGQINALLGYILIMGCSVLIVSSSEKSTFCAFYVVILLIYGCISLGYNFIANFYPKLGLQLCQPGYDWYSLHGYSLLYTWGTSGSISKRNAGPFWEPGAFQGYLLLAILFILYDLDRGKIKNKKAVLALLLIILLTTRSTTGYLLLMLVFLTLSGRILEIFGIKKNKRIIAIVVVFIVVISVLNSATVVMKLNREHDSISRSMRLADLTGGIKLTAQAGPFGLGLTDYVSEQRRLLRMPAQDSNGITSLGYTFGWFYLGLYLFYVCRIPKSFFGERSVKKRFLLIMLFIALHMTECLWSFPVYWILILAERTKSPDPDLTKLE